MDAQGIIANVTKVKGSKVRTALKNRWDGDLNIYLRDAHKMKGSSGTALPGVYNVTSSDPQTYMDRITGLMSRAEPRLHIVSSLADEQVRLVENWWKCVLYSANKLYSGNSETALFPSLAFYTNLRGYPITRNVIYRDENNETIFDIKPLDSYDTYWKKYGNRLAWACVVSSMEPEDIEAFFEITVKEKTDVYNYWDKDGTEYIIIGENFKSYPREFINYVPFSICPVVTTPQVNGLNTNKDSMVGESLYHSVRDTIKERNDILSIIKTHAMLGMRPPLVHTSDGTTAREIKEYPAEWGTVMEQLAEEKFDSLKFSDMANTNAMFFNMMDQEYQRGTVPNNEYGGLNFQLSSLALDTLSSQRGVVFLPRQTTLENMYKSIFNQMFQQFVDGKFDTSMIDDSGAEISIKFSDLAPLQNKFRVDFDVDVESPEEETSNYQKAVMALNARMPLDFIVRNVFKAEDPDRLLAIIADENLMRELPEMRLVRAYDQAMKDSANLKGDAKAAKLLEAKLLEGRITQIIQSMQPQQQPGPTQGTAPGQVGPGRGAPTTQGVM
jgi:hypothetical protein